MSDGDRHDRLPHNLGAPLWLAALILFAVLVFSLGMRLGIDAGRDEVTAREHYERVKQDELGSCVGMDATAARECVIDAIEAAQEQSDSRQDLYAQQDMAKFALWMIVVSSAAVFVTIVGIYYVRATLEANTAAAAAAQSQADLMRKAERGSLAVIVENGRQDLFQTVVPIVFRNIGRSSLTVERFRYYLNWSEPTDQLLGLLRDLPSRRFLIKEGDSVTINIGAHDGQDFYILGHALSRDVFGQFEISIISQWFQWKTKTVHIFSRKDVDAELQRRAERDARDYIEHVESLEAAAQRAQTPAKSR